MTIAELNQQHGIAGQVSFSEGTGGLPFVTITNEFATAKISLYGAHVTSYQPKGEKDILWMSEQSAFEAGKPIRGGIPVCFPWFGPHATDTTKPQHGFARLTEWAVKSTATLANGANEIQLSLTSNDETQNMWPFAFSAVITVTVADKLSITLSVKNTGTETFTYTDALHTYFNVSDLSNIDIAGLQNATYLEAGSTEIKTQAEALLLINKEENRRYNNHTGDCIITDKGYNRKISVGKTGSKITVVWNPGEATTKNIGDIPDDGYKTFICVEAVNALDDVVTITPGNEYSTSAVFGLA
ncbi:D-hexose-6-phosphate mutarotase [Ferruginibacter lapsinanis]|uniref:D-hexose-6-phosphate mutarotase n=1 Tax=Ferruginibacter lapsinanis TaxID=563172 RepID=UPI001E645D7F|nr:D-hexose-6-phosphate mutarotase [Ferruginibacter lapsinanis]UEG49757.1 D-hexose-6-phosphate mutarotase [Ferruginibacter lapsinanis]